MGLIFTLKTHVHLLEDKEAGGEGGEHDGPPWSKTKCVVILLFCTVLFAAVSEALVNSLEPSLEVIGLSQTFAGVTVIALVPSTAEFANAVGFALKNSKTDSLITHFLSNNLFLFLFFFRLFNEFRNWKFSSCSISADSNSCIGVLLSNSEPSISFTI